MWPPIGRKDGYPDQNAAMALRTALPRRWLRCGNRLPRLNRGGNQFGDRREQQFAAEFEFMFAEPVGEESEIPDALESGWQGVNEEPADELIGRKRQDA